MLSLYSFIFENNFCLEFVFFFCWFVIRGLKEIGREGTGGRSYICVFFIVLVRGRLGWLLLRLVSMISDYFIYLCLRWVGKEVGL